MAAIQNSGFSPVKFGMYPENKASGEGQEKNQLVNDAMLATLQKITPDKVEIRQKKGTILPKAKNLETVFSTPEVSLPSQASALKNLLDATITDVKEQEAVKVQDTQEETQGLVSEATNLWESSVQTLNNLSKQVERAVQTVGDNKDSLDALKGLRSDALANVKTSFAPLLEGLNTKLIEVTTLLAKSEQSMQKSIDDGITRTAQVVDQKTEEAANRMNKLFSK